MWSRTVPEYSRRLLPRHLQGELDRLRGQPRLDWLLVDERTTSSPASFSSSTIDSVPSLVLAVTPFPPAMALTMLIGAEGRTPSLHAAPSSESRRAALHRFLRRLSSRPYLERHRPLVQEHLVPVDYRSALSSASSAIRSSSVCTRRRRLSRAHR